MSSADGRYVVVYNGEIYNYRGLTTELAAHGLVSAPGANRGARRCVRAMGRGMR